MDGMMILGIVLLVAGFLLIAVEILVPGFGLPGISGIICLIAGILTTADTVEQGLTITVIVIVLLAVMLTVMNPGEFMCCHKSYIVNLSMISKLEPYGRWTYVVKFKGTKETALMTFQKYEELKKLFG